MPVGGWVERGGVRPGAGGRSVRPRRGGLRSGRAPAESSDGGGTRGTFAGEAAHFQARLLHNTPAKWGPGLTVPIIPNEPVVQAARPPGW